MEQEQSMMLIDTDVLINLFDPFKHSHHVADEALAEQILLGTLLFV